MFVSQDEMTLRAARHYDAQRNDRNERMARVRWCVNNHMGLGRYEGMAPECLAQETLTSILDDLENNQTEALIARMGSVTARHRVLDAGCGRGGPAFRLHLRSGCSVDGVTVSDYQRGVASESAVRLGVDDRVRFHLMNYCELRFPDESFDLVFTNETTMHAFRLDDLFAEFSRVLSAGGRYTLATWAANEDLGACEEHDAINRNYQCLIHSRAEYVTCLRRQGFEILSYEDLTELAIPYWTLRAHWAMRSGIESAFLEGHRSRTLLYLMISARKRRPAEQRRMAMEPDLSGSP
jgi:geranyl diphosphate 2-C-methyltransferase